MSEANKALIRRLLQECFNQHNVDLYPEFYSETFVQHTPAMGKLGAEQHRQLLISLFAAFPDSHWTVVDQIGESEKVVTRWTLLATHLGAFMGIAPSGKQLISGGVCIDHIVDGKIVEEWEEWDTLGMMQQLGAVPFAKVDQPLAL